jgi:RNA polymerase sigma factor (sigma-70 family)
MAKEPFTAVLEYLRKICATEELQKLPDGDLLERFLTAREEAAFAVVVHRHGPMVLGVCQRVLGDTHDAEDAFQATFMVLVRRAGSVRREAPLSNWLYGVAQRVALKSWAKMAARRSRQRELREMPRTEPLDELTWQELRPVLDEEIARLPQQCRAAIVHCYLEGKSYDQAAQELGWPKSSLASRLARGRELLRQRLVKRGIALSATALTTALAEKTAPAAVGALLTINTAKAAAAIAAGKSVAGTILSAEALALTEEAIMGMFAIKGKAMLAAIALSLAIGGAGLAGYHGFSGLAPDDVTPLPQHDGNVLADLPQPETNTALAQKKEAVPARDLYGDPLPEFATTRLGTLRWRHDAVIRFAAFLPDGKSVVSVAGDQTIRVWEFPSGNELRRIIVNSEGKRELIAVLGGGDDLASQIQFAAALSVDGKIIATYFDSPVRSKKKASNPQIHLHEVGTGKELPSLSASGLDVTKLVFSPQGEHLMSTDYDGTVRIWDWAKAKQLRSFASPRREDTERTLSPYMTLDASVYAPDGNALIFLNGTNALRLVDVRTGQETGASGHTMPVRSVQFAPNGNQLTTQADDTSTIMWDAATGKDLGSIVKRVGKVSSKSFRKVVQVASPDGTILVDLKQISFTVKSKEEDLTLVDIATGRVISKISITRTGPTFQPCLQFSSDNKLLAVVNSSSTLRSIEDQRIDLFDVATGKCLHTLTDATVPQQVGKAKVLNLAQTLVFSPDSQVLAWSLGSNVFLWSTTTGERIGMLPMPTGAPLRNFAFTPDGRCLALDRNDGTVLLCELATAERRHIFGRPLPKAGGKPAINVDAPPQGGVDLQIQRASRIAISPNGKSLALAAEDRKIHVWDCVTGRELAAFEGHVGRLNAVAFSPDSKLVASASADTTALVWDLSKVDRMAPAAKVLKPSELEQRWQVLADSDGSKAFAAICDLMASPNEAVAFMKVMIKPTAPPDRKAVEALIVQLDDAQFNVRDKAAAELYKIGDAIIPSLDNALRGSLTLENKRRMVEMRSRLTSKILKGDRLRAFRAVEVLERIGTPESRRVLEELAAGAPGTLLTTSAQAALKR